jgi:hypothetical protein
MKVTIDRFEDGYAVLLWRGDESISIDFPRVLLPKDCKEGDILDIDISRDTAATDEARERVSGLIEKLKKKSQ